MRRKYEKINIYINEKKMFNHDDYINTNDFNKFLGTIIDERLKVMKGASSCKHRQAINTM